MTHPDILAEIYGLILNKHFRPELKSTDEPDVYKLYLWSPNGKYYTIYELKPGKIKWKAGVMPWSILK